MKDLIHAILALVITVCVSFWWTYFLLAKMKDKRRAIGLLIATFILTLFSHIYNGLHIIWHAH